MILFLALNTRSPKNVIYLLLYLLVRNYQNPKTMFVLYVSIKLLHNGIPIPIGLVCYEILILIGFFTSRIVIFIALFYFKIAILIEIS